MEPTLARSQSGLGLGLTMVQRLVEMHGGRVRADSEGIGRGAQITIELPLAIDNAIGNSGVIMRRGGRGLAVLLVDDNVDACEIFQIALQQAGHRVDVAFDGKKGLDLVLSGAYDVAVVDIGLPILDGYGIAEATLREMGARRPFLIACTGYGRAEDRARALAAGFDEHLVKPVDLDDLEQAFELARRSVRERARRA